MPVLSLQPCKSKGLNWPFFHSWGSYRAILVMRAWLILFSVKREFRKLFFMTHDLKVLHDPWRTWIINWYSWIFHSVLRDFETQVLRMVRIVYGEWLRHAICNMEPWLSHSRVCFLQTLFLMHKVEQVIKKSILLSYFRDLGKRNFLYPWTMILNFLKLVNGAKDTPCTSSIFLEAFSDCNARFAMAWSGENTAPISMIASSQINASLRSLQYALDEQLTSANFLCPWFSQNCHQNFATGTTYKHSLLSKC